jgi:peptidoglycan hydrolase CwlO-like protein
MMCGTHRSISEHHGSLEATRDRLKSEIKTLETTVAVLEDKRADLTAVESALKALVSRVVFAADEVDE